MAGSICLDCHTRCLHCTAGSYANGVCICDELQDAHVKSFHRVGLQRSAQPYFSNDGSGILEGIETLDFLSDASGGGWADEQPRTLSDLAENPFCPDPSVELDILNWDNSLPPQPPISGRFQSDQISQALSFMERGGAQLLSTASTRRRDYTQEEKEAFEQWITDNPNPTKAQKATYALSHGLTEDQLKNRIHNRKRKALPKATAESVAAEELQSLLAKQNEIQSRISSILRSDKTEGGTMIMDSLNGQTEQLDNFPVDDAEIRMPVSTSNLRRNSISSRKNGSYSSIEEYLNSEEEAVPVESIRKASQSVAREAFRRYNTHRMPSSRQSSLQSSIASRTSSAGHRSVTSSVVSSAHSYASCESRNRVIKTRRQNRSEKAMTALKAVKELVSFQCNFCGCKFDLRKELVAHETNSHCLPQTFPCTFCSSTFTSLELWESHESLVHCQLQTTWFCELDNDGEWDVEKCIFCEALLPTLNHYKSAHGLISCNLPLPARCFATRGGIMDHLMAVHGISASEFTGENNILNELDSWSLQLDISNNEGLWGCGYCGIIGTNWSSRVRHIKTHWIEGGPRFTKLHPWESSRTTPSNSEILNFRKILSNFGLKPSDRSGLPSMASLNSTEIAASKVQPTKSLFASFANKSKEWLSFAKSTRQKSREQDTQWT